MHHTRCGELNSRPSDAVVEFDVRTKGPREAARSAYPEKKKNALPRYGFGSSRSLQKQSHTPLAIETVWCFHEWTDTCFAEGWSLQVGRSEHKIIDNIPLLDRLYIRMQLKSPIKSLTVLSDLSADAFFYNSVMMECWISMGFLEIIREITSCRATPVFS